MQAGTHRDVEGLVQNRSEIPRRDAFVAETESADAQGRIGRTEHLKTRHVQQGMPYLLA